MHAGLPNLWEGMLAQCQMADWPGERGHWWGAVAEGLRNSGLLAADCSPLGPGVSIKSYCKTIEHSQVNNVIKTASLAYKENAHL